MVKVKSKPVKKAIKGDKLVRVKWIDTVTDDSWVTKESAKKWSRRDFECESVGWLIEKDRKHVIIVSMKGGDDVAMSQKIPRGCVKSIKRI